jgi:23S rRNA (guanosine2251-2'-O)-methyltransferase
MQKKRKTPAGGTYWLYGRHACEAALKNPARKCVRFCATEKALQALPSEIVKTRPVDIVSVDQIERYVGKQAVHQGMAMSVEPLRPVPPHYAGERHTVAILDHVVDPQNVGAVLRCAAAFGVDCVYVHDRGCPEESAAMAKAASGHLETVPLVRVKNIADLIRHLQKDGFFVAALDAHGGIPLEKAAFAPRQAFLFGSEGKGVRPLLRELADMAVIIPMANGVESLNIAMTAGIVLCRRFALSSTA